jgi:hypothetical protein
VSAAVAGSCHGAHQVCKRHTGRSPSSCHLAVRAVIVLGLSIGFSQAGLTLALGGTPDLPDENLNGTGTGDGAQPRDETAEESVHPTANRVPDKDG